jgi:hypothetical protein
LGLPALSRSRGREGSGKRCHRQDATARTAD